MGGRFHKLRTPAGLRDLSQDRTASRAYVPTSVHLSRMLDRADEARARAADMRDVNAKATMMQIAHSYEAMADRVSQREAKPGT